MIPHKEIIFLDIKEKVFIDNLSSRAIFAKIADLAGLVGLLIHTFSGCSLKLIRKVVYEMCYTS